MMGWDDYALSWKDGKTCALYSEAGIDELPCLDWLTGFACWAYALLS